MWSRSTKQRRAAMRRRWSYRLFATDPRAMWIVRSDGYLFACPVILDPSRDARAAPDGYSRDWVSRDIVFPASSPKKRGLAAWLPTAVPTADSFFALDPRPSVILGPDATDADVEAALARTDTCGVLKQVYPPKETK